MKWAPRIKPVEIGRLYRLSRIGVYDDELLLEVGWGLYARCRDVVAVARAIEYGEVPCPQCGTNVKRRNILSPAESVSLSSEKTYRSGWFHCSCCLKRLLWSDCRDALRETPHCFDCYSMLKLNAETNRLECQCGKSWATRQYRQSVTRRLRLPCPECGSLIRRPNFQSNRWDANNDGERKASSANREFLCPKCGKTAVHSGGYLHCPHCDYRRRWRNFRKSLKRRDEKLLCHGCGHIFKWQMWKKEVSSLKLRTGHPFPAHLFLKKWPNCKKPEEKMLQIDFLIQALHGRGALAPVFIAGNERNIRQLLDQLAVQV